MDRLQDTVQVDAGDGHRPVRVARLAQELGHVRPERQVVVGVRRVGEHTHVQVDPVLVRLEASGPDRLVPGAQGITVVAVHQRVDVSVRQLLRGDAEVLVLIRVRRARTISYFVVDQTVKGHN